jgi:hypothetical protein
MEIDLNPSTLWLSAIYSVVNSSEVCYCNTWPVGMHINHDTRMIKVYSHLLSSFSSSNLFLYLLSSLLSYSFPVPSTSVSSDILMFPWYHISLFSSHVLFRHFKNYHYSVKYQLDFDIHHMELIPLKLFYSMLYWSLMKPIYLFANYFAPCTVLFSI